MRTGALQAIGILSCGSAPAERLKTTELQHENYDRKLLDMLIKERFSVQYIGLVRIHVLFKACFKHQAIFNFHFIFI